MRAVSIVERLRGTMQGIGYRPELVRSDYQYANVSRTAYTVGSVNLAAFAQVPPSYRNACIGVIVSNGHTGASHVAQHRSLGAPMIFEIAGDFVHRWKITSSGEPELRQSIPPDEIEEVFIANKQKWAPDRIFRAKAISPTPEIVEQLDFIDIGLMPALEGMIHEKLDRLLRNTLTIITNIYEDTCREKPNHDELFRLVFRLIAAKLLRDREHVGNWSSSNGAAVLQAVEEYYRIGSESLLLDNMRRPEILDQAWEQISSAFHFQNLSVDDLAFIYENTLITEEARKDLGIHSTPRQVAEYIVQKLPLESLPEDDRHVLEPCAGHGVFLISAMRRLRELLSRDLSDEDRHAYFVAHVAGIEIEPFALEVCHLSLILADYPNPDGWRLFKEDVFAGGRLDQELRSADIVLCNPPFGEFTATERAGIEGSYTYVQKPAELLARILKRPPQLLGIVLPRVFNFGFTYRSLHRKLAQTYGEIELVALPEVFNYSGSPTVLVLAMKRGHGLKQATVTCRNITKQQSHALSIENEPSGHTRTLAIPEDQLSAFTLWTPRLSLLWDYLDGLPKLGDECEIHQGVHWKGRVGKYKRSEKRTDVISDEAKDGFVKGFAWVEDCFGQYSIQCERFLSLRPEHQHDGGYKYRWDLPKVVCNTARLRRHAWRLGAVADASGRAFSKRFFAFWPSESISIYSLAAVLNSPVASAYVHDKDQGIDNRKRTLQTLPIPPLSALVPDGLIDSLSREIHFEFQKRIEEGANRGLGTLHALLLRIDAAVIQAYGLPPALESELLGLFAGLDRPVQGLSVTGYDKDYEITRVEIMAEQRQLTRIDRYQELVTRDFTTGLSTAEARKMEQLGKEIDAYYDPYYDMMHAEPR